MTAAMTRIGWAALAIPDLATTVVKPNYWMCSFIDGKKTNIDGAIGELFATTHPLGLPNYRLLVTVFNQITEQEKDALLLKHMGTRMDKQVVVAVIYFPNGQVYLPSWSAWLGYRYPCFDPAVGNDVTNAFRDAQRPH
jgi:hypothetical protein